MSAAKTGTVAVQMTLQGEPETPMSTPAKQERSVSSILTEHEEAGRRPSKKKADSAVKRRGGKVQTAPTSLRALSAVQIAFFEDIRKGFELDALRSGVAAARLGRHGRSYLDPAVAFVWKKFCTHNSLITFAPAGDELRELSESFERGAFADQDSALKLKRFTKKAAGGYEFELTEELFRMWVTAFRWQQGENALQG